MNLWVVHRDEMMRFYTLFIDKNLFEFNQCQVYEELSAN